MFLKSYIYRQKNYICISLAGKLLTANADTEKNNQKPFL